MCLVIAGKDRPCEQNFNFLSLRNKINGVFCVAIRAINYRKNTFMALVFFQLFFMSSIS
jgi:hypothetical protein